MSRRAIEGHTVVVTSRDSPHLELVMQFHADHIRPTFAENEVEDVAMWIDRLTAQSERGPIKQLLANEGADAYDFEFALALLVRDVDQVVVGAAVHEVYLKARCGLVSYIVVADWLRGKGAAGLLMDAVFDNCAAVLAQHYGPMETLRAVFIEVLQVRDDHSDEDDPHTTSASKFRSSDRQVIFSRLGFLPVDLDFVHPGKMKGHRYNIGLASRTYDYKSGVFPSAFVLAFLEGLVMGILADEGVTDDTEMLQWRALLDGKDVIPVGGQYWR